MSSFSARVDEKDKSALKKHVFSDNYKNYFKQLNKLILFVLLFFFSKLALIQTNVIIDELKKMNPDTTFEIGENYKQYGSDNFSC